MKTVKTVLWYVVGVVLALVGQLLSEIVSRFIFLTLLPKIPLIPFLLSWPSGYNWYATIGILSIMYWVPVLICRFFGGLTDTRINYGVVLISILNAFLCIRSYVGTLAAGFSLSTLGMYAIAFFMLFGAFAVGYKND